MNVSDFLVKLDALMNQLKSYDVPDRECVADFLVDMDALASEWYNTTDSENESD